MQLKALAYLLVSLLVKDSHQYQSKEWLLSDHLSSGHDKYIAPDTKSPVSVFFSLKLVQLFEVNEKRQSMLSSLWLQQRWFDSRLKWNETSFDGIHEISISRQLLWTPDIILDNNIHDSYMGRPVGMNSPLLVKSNGEVRWLTPVILTSHCKLDVQYFPFDEQFCPLEFLPLTHTKDEIVVVPEQIDEELSNFTTNGEWKVERVYPIKNFKPTADLRDITKERTCVTYIVHVQRKSFYYFLYLISPCLLTSLLTIMVFALPPSSGERIAVGVTLLLSVTVFFMLASTHIPETSEAVPLIGKYYSLTIIQVSMALGLTCLVLRYHHRDPSLGPVHSWIRVVVIGYVARLVRIKVSDSKLVTQEENMNKKDLNDASFALLKTQQDESEQTKITSNPKENNKEPFNKEKDEVAKIMPKARRIPEEMQTAKKDKENRSEQSTTRKDTKQSRLIETTAVIESPPEGSKLQKRPNKEQSGEHKAKGVEQKVPLKSVKKRKSLSEVSEWETGATEPVKSLESQPIKSASEPTVKQGDALEAPAALIVMHRPMKSSHKTTIDKSQPIKSDSATMEMSLQGNKLEPIRSPLPRQRKKTMNNRLPTVEEVPEGRRSFLKITSIMAPVPPESTRETSNKDLLSPGSEIERTQKAKENRARKHTNKKEVITKTCASDQGNTQNRRSLPSCPSGVVMLAEQTVRHKKLGTIQAEWRLAAAVLNRLFLGLYIIAVVLSVAGIFGQVPGFIISRPDPPKSS